MFLITGYFNYVEKEVAYLQHPFDRPTAFGFPEDMWSVLSASFCFVEKELSSFQKSLWYLSIAIAWSVAL